MQIKNNKMRYRQLALPVITTLSLMVFFVMGQAIGMQSMGFAFVAAGLSAMISVQAWRNTQTKNHTAVPIITLGDK